MATTLFYTLNFPAKHLLETTKNHLQPVLRSVAPVISLTTVIKTHTHTHTRDHSCHWSHPLRLTLWRFRCEVLAKERADLVCVDMAPLSALDAADVAHLDSKGLVTNGVVTFGIPVKHDRRHSPTGPHHPISWELSLSNPKFGPHLRLLVLPLLESSLKQECWS